MITDPKGPSINYITRILRFLDPPVLWRHTITFTLYNLIIVDIFFLELFYQHFQVGIIIITWNLKNIFENCLIWLCDITVFKIPGPPVTFCHKSEMLLPPLLCDVIYERPLSNNILNIILMTGDHYSWHFNKTSLEKMIIKSYILFFML